jgi:phosphoadenosine phosphosulfate reductase
VLGERLTGRTAVVSSFGAESAVLLHLVASVDPATPVIFLDTGKHFPETLAYRDLLIARLGLTDVRIVSPDPARLAERDATELRWSYDPDGCCEIRKVEPLARILAEFDSSITGRKGFQSSTRTALPAIELDGGDAAGRLKVNPLAGWTKADLDAYFETHDLPRHPLEAQGYPSIGCSPCTSVVKPGEDPRSGRWRGWDKVECGIHTPVDGADQPSF